MIKHLVMIACCTIAGSSAMAQSITIFGNSDAQECYMATRLDGGGAIDLCTKALKDGGLSARDRSATLINRGINLSQAGQHTKALEDYAAALAINPDLAEAFLNRGNTYVFLGRFDTAVEDYSMAIELETRKLHAAYFNRGLAYEGLKNLESAFADFSKALELSPEWALPMERVERYQEFGFK